MDRVSVGKLLHYERDRLSLRLSEYRSRVVEHNPVLQRVFAELYDVETATDLLRVEHRLTLKEAVYMDPD